MRGEMIALAVMLSALAACDKQPAAQDVRQADQELARDDLDSNDLTAIDAASGADSNMAADIDFTNMALNGDNESQPANRQSSRRPRPAPTERDDSDSPAAANASQPPETDDGAN